MNKVFITLVVIISMGWSACKKVEKNVADYYPTVKTISATAQADGSILVTGKVAPGDFPVTNVGFCLDTAADASIIVNQVRSQMEADGTFTAEYAGYSSVKTYYVRTWATNENGIGLGNVVSIGNVQMDTTKFQCYPALNTMLLEGSNNPVQTIGYKSTIGAGSTTEIICSNFTMYLTFNKYPVTGIYTITTATSFSGNGNYVNMSYGDASLAGSIELTHNNVIYVQEITATQLEITICRAEVDKLYSNPYYITGRFRILRSQ